MWRRCVVVLLFASSVLAAGRQPPKDHPDWVPDQKTAERIAEAALIAQFGEDRVKQQMPLVASLRGKKSWLVEGELPHQPGIIVHGGNFGVWVDKHSGCLTVMEHMK